VASGRETSEARRLFPWLRTLRRRLHRHPELANEEFETSRLVCETLEGLGLNPRTFPGFTGVMADITPLRGTSRDLVAIRADLDALPVTEATGVPFASETPGRMHACGHDVHMACLLGAAKLWVEESVPLRGPVRLLFQPAEEQGVDGGAAPFIRRGALERPRPSYVIGQHVDQALPVGSVGLRAGPMMAASDSIDLEVRGLAGHGGYPQLGPDAILVASEIVVGLQALVSRAKNPIEPAVITIGSIHGGEKRNVLPAKVHLSGTIRTFSDALRGRYEREIPRRCRGIAKSLGASVRVKYERGYPPLVNDAAVTQVVATALRTAWGEGRVRSLAEPVMGAEDFARYLEQVPGTFWFLGVGPKNGGAAAPKHTPSFLPEERAMTTGTEALLRGAAALHARGAAR
jgi:amidohydrolase